MLYSTVHAIMQQIPYIAGQLAISAANVEDAHFADEGETDDVEVCLGDIIADGEAYRLTFDIMGVLIALDKMTWPEGKQIVYTPQTLIIVPEKIKYESSR